MIASGVAPAEVGYQLAFSKQELLKCIALYPAKEVKKNLEVRAFAPSHTHTPTHTVGERPQMYPDRV